MIRKFSLAKGMFSGKISLATGIWSKTRAAHPHQKIFWVPPREILPKIGYVFGDWTASGAQDCEITLK